MKNVQLVTPPPITASAFLGALLPPPINLPAFPMAGAAATNPFPPWSTSTSRSAMPFGMGGLATVRGRANHSTSTSQTLNYTAPRSLNAGVPPNAMTAPPTSCDMEEECSICFDQLKKRSCVALRACKHCFHNDCVRQAFNSKPQCPICRKSIGEPRGTSPSGEMRISTSPVQCASFRKDSILITYNIPSAPQMSYHDNPGVSHGGKYESAYLPNNSDGQNLCKRLKFAFMHGLIFTVGTSMTTGAPNQCTVSFKKLALILFILLSRWFIVSYFI